MNAKDRLRAAIEALPDSITWDEAIEQLASWGCSTVPEARRPRSLNRTEAGPDTARQQPRSVGRVVAVDWSGARSGAHRKIWTAVVENGQLRELVDGRSREEVGRWLAAEAARDPDLVVGLDFPFSFPAWFVRWQGCETAADFWSRVAKQGEEWLVRPLKPPFHTRGRWPEIEAELRRGASRAHDLPCGQLTPFRQTDQAHKAETCFKLVGARQVAAGALRGMPILRDLASAGFSIWPFDAPRLPLVVEIFPAALYVSPVTKSDSASRLEYLERHHPQLGDHWRELANRSDDAFDAAVSAFMMDAHRDEFARLGVEEDTGRRLEGVIWTPEDGR